ncbi:MAG: glutamine--fructose-6-phosphate transaminase (isomerizing) [Bacteroidia bacterium]|nr:glutamine--fructose-6-phosphate transaminase (isomerizing) [Bacteroidia bacterium]
MCGIVGYIGNRQAYPILIKGLHRLEYRGYDSAGIALIDQDHLKVYKAKGKVAELEQFAQQKDTSGTIGIAHTRWATHGEPTQNNAHPHYSQSEDIAIIHNGIIENHAILKDGLIKEGYRFQSQTDTEVLVQLIEYMKITHDVDLPTAVQLALTQVVGAYAIAVLERNKPDLIVTARKGSPLVIGIGEDEYFIGSDATPLIEYTNQVIYVGDEEIVTIKRNEPLKIKTIGNIEKTPEIQKLELTLSQLEKSGYPHFMLKEIFEQPATLSDCMRGRVNVESDNITLAGFIDNRDKFLNARRIIITACGTSWHAAQIGMYSIEEYARIPVEVEYSSEFRYRKPVIHKDDIVIAISQSGETADTLAAVELAKQQGAFIFGICNVVGSSIPRNTHSGCYTHVGPEIGVASTKAFTAQVAVLTMLGILIAKEKGTITSDEYVRFIKELSLIPDKVGEVLQKNDQIAELAKTFTYASNCIYLGRGYNFPVALEGAPKLKEISYIHAEGYPAAEMKHGPIALISHEMPVIAIATQSDTYEKVASNIQEIKARKGRIISIVTEGDEAIRNLSAHTIEVPETIPCLTPLLSVIPLQLLAYHIAVEKGCDVDQPRNLAKSVTVE